MFKRCKKNNIYIYLFYFIYIYLFYFIYIYIYIYIFFFFFFFCAEKKIYYGAYVLLKPENYFTDEYSVHHRKKQLSLKCAINDHPMETVLSVPDESSGVN